MIIDIQRTVIRTQLRRFLTLIAFLVVIILVILIGSLRRDFLGLNKYIWALFIGCLYIITIVAEAFLELNYIFFSDEKELIILRFFSMSMFSRKKNSIEIPKNVFRGYEIRKTLFGLKKKIILFQRLKDKDVKYPAVSLSGLNPQEFGALTKTLDKYK